MSDRPEGWIEITDVSVGISEAVLQGNDRVNVLVDQDSGKLAVQPAKDGVLKLTKRANWKYLRSPGLIKWLRSQGITPGIYGLDKIKDKWEMEFRPEEAKV